MERVMKMEFIKEIIQKRYNNFLFIGEAGSGKSEIAINFARYLLMYGDKPVHFFDMDMTKPLFRSRDLCAELTGLGIEFHYEEQFMDAPTLVGGVNRLLKKDDCYVVMDVGGDYIGARSIGGFSQVLNKEHTMIYYVLNVYRPWSNDIEHIDKVLGEILEVSHIHIEKLHLISNPNIGHETKAKEVLNGNRKLEEMVTPYKTLDFVCVSEDLFEEVKNSLPIPVMPIHLYLKYPWIMLSDNFEG